ncbi:hypothetical protein F0562_022073 [Nyssa sinensis]|uniref:Uncharacterized protein n=1 Tax=Nyssa sinensis TaxID=561372 RepID=A0A5J5BNM4_9ASTE|nr:hypothetical protein F0562_022073 [Nyssa sinensis]
MFINAYKNVLSVAVTSEYSFPQAEKVKEFLKDPTKFAVAVAAPVAAAEFWDCSCRLLLRRKKKKKKRKVMMT